MIGQTKLKAQLLKQIEEDKLPRFIILVGERGQGKKLLADWVTKELNSIKYICGTKIADIRDMIEQSYKIAEETVYIIPDGDNMSEEAKNAMLKVVEEPPNKARFILTLQDLENTLPTIRGRAVAYRLEEYSQVELLGYCKETNIDCDDWVLSVAENPYEINVLTKYKGFKEYVNLVVDNIAVTSGANSFKIADKIALKSEEDKYDLKLFWRAFIFVCLDRYKEDVKKFCKAIQITSKYIQELRVKSINFSSTFDMWLLDIRKEWLKD